MIFLGLAQIALKSKLWKKKTNTRTKKFCKYQMPPPLIHLQVWNI